jgi:pyruvate-ferredoxin/flavodoxin oxidoreductase
VARLDADHQLELDALRHQYEEAVEAREGSIDSIAQAMSELAAASKAPPAGGLSLGLGGGAAVAPAAAPAAAAKPNGAAVALSEDDVASCTNCKTCYQELPELFEKTRVVVDGATKEAGHLIPGALARVKITPEIKSKIARVAANCDADIIHEH